MDREQLYYVLFEQQKDFKKKEDFVPRELTSEVLSRLHLKLPIIITGLRRVGKSTLLKILTEELNLSDKECFYINFNDERLISFTPSDFQKILDFLNEQDYKENCYLFIDEIQEVSKWEKWIDRIKEKYSIIITGSNSKLLSKEISTVLTGRSVNVSLYPFSFKEVLASKNIKLNEIKLDLKLQAQVRKEFLSFLNKGGIPKPVIDDDEKLLVELYENII
ncbi:MAG: AAA family ATPase [Nanoarchaeota archaeon]|nr:AAA family ATPase [Nanoarchaeota archaeon]